MPELTLQSTARRPQTVTTPVEPDDATAGIAQAAASAPVEQNRDSFTREQQMIVDWRAEIDGYLVRMKTLGSKAPDEVMLVLSGITARLTEIKVQLHRSESRRLSALRVHEVDVTLVEVETQFKLFSRLQSIREFDWEVSGKGQI